MRCEKEATKFADISHNTKIYFADIDWYYGVIAVSPRYFEDREDTVFFACNEKHLRQAVINKLMLDKLE